MIPPSMPREEGGGGCRSAGGDPPDSVEACRAAAASAIALTVSVLYFLFRDVLCLFQSGLVCTFLLEGECRDVAGGVRLESGTGILLSAEERREVLGRIGGGRAAPPRRSVRGDI